MRYEELTIEGAMLFWRRSAPERPIDRLFSPLTDVRTDRCARS